jgi:hypothetical protein
VIVRISGKPLSMSRLVVFSTPLLVCAVMMFMASATAQAAPPAPGWEVFARFGPSVLKPGGEAQLILDVYNVGAITGAGTATLVDTLPGGITATGGPCSGTTVVTCNVGPLEPIAPGGTIRFEIPVSIAGTAQNGPSAVNRVTISGGGALTATSSSLPVTFSNEPAPLGFSNFAAWLTNADGTPDTQAGSHPYALTVAFSVDTEGLGAGNETPTGGEVHSINVDLPPGLVGNPRAVPQCPRPEFDTEEPGCPPNTMIGWDDVEPFGGLGQFDIPVYNLVPPPGVAAQFGFTFNGISTFLNSRVRSGGDNGITTHTNAVPQEKIVFNTTTIWGMPSEHISGVEPEPFLTMPTSCRSPLKFGIEEVGTWQHPDAPPVFKEYESVDNNDVPSGLTGCDRMVHFNPIVSIAPDTSFSDTPAGLTATVKVPQGLNPEGLATPGLKETTVTLPEGVVVNPGQATGLAACQPSQENIGGPESEKESMDGPPSCPAASKIGTDEISTPLLPNRLKGNVYILQNNPPELQILVAASGEGVNLKLIGTVHLDEKTGRLTTTFKGTPQDPGTPDAPLNEFVLSFSGGAQAALVTPETCGVYGANVDFTPWSTPFTKDALEESTFQITSGPGGSGVSACTGPLPFSPTMTAGSTTDQAGGYTDFSLLLTRPDGQQRVESLSFKAPEGLAGMISKVPLCPEPRAAEGTCPTSSQIGHTVVGAGPGPYPLFLPQAGAPPAPIYLTGPYDGAPFGLSIVVPIEAGPFNLGTVKVRAKIEIDPKTAQITVTTTPFPTIVAGIPADLRSINAVIDRPEFMFNPTDCSPMSFSGTAISTGGVVAPLSSHFQMGSCQALKFQPNFKVSTTGKTTRINGASLTAKIVYPTGNLGFNQASSQSNINSVKVDLPKQLPSRLTTLQKACPAATFQANPASCPAASVVGHAKAVTPVLPVPLEGPAYFVSHAGEEFPSLIVVLQGYGVTVELVGSTFINSKTNITSSTFKQVPDVPIGSFELVLPQGKYSALAANGNLCKSKLKMPTAFIAQNGARLNQSTPITVTGCTKHKTKTKAKKSVHHKTKKK